MLKSMGGTHKAVISLFLGFLFVHSVLADEKSHKVGYLDFKIHPCASDA